MHMYEIRKLEKNGKVTTIRMLTAEPKSAKDKKGVPYLDTFYSLHLTDGNLELRNTEGDTSIASCRSTEGCANRRK